MHLKMLKMNVRRHLRRFYRMFTARTVIIKFDPSMPPIRTLEDHGVRLAAVMVENPDKLFYS